VLPTGTAGTDMYRSADVSWNAVPDGDHRPAARLDTAARRSIRRWLATL